MKRIRWNHVYYKFVVLILLVLLLYLFISNTKVYSQLNQNWIYKLTPTNWIQTKTNSNKSSFIKYSDNLTFHYDIPNESDELEYKKLSRFDAIPFKTVEDAWSKDNLILAPYIKAGRMTAHLSPSFRVNYINLY